MTYTSAAVERRDITSSISGSGSLEAANSYSVTSLVEGSILTADFEEGAQVEAGMVLYTVDSSDAASSLEQSEISLQQAQRSYQRQLENQDDLNVSSTASGRVYSIDVEVGDEVNAGETVATVRNSDTMTLEATFPADEAAAFSVGQAASVTLDSTFETLSGTVTKVSGNTEVLSGNVLVRAVTIDVAVILCFYDITVVLHPAAIDLPSMTIAEALHGEAVFQDTLPELIYHLLKLGLECGTVPFFGASRPPSMPNLVAASPKVHADMTDAAKTLVLRRMLGIEKASLLRRSWPDLELRAIHLVFVFCIIFTSFSGYSYTTYHSLVQIAMTKRRI